MKLSRRLLAILLSMSLVLTAVPASVFAADEDVIRMDNGYIEVCVSKKNGGFRVNTVEGDLLRKSDNNKKLLYHSGDYDTSFVSFRVGEGENAKDYLFGGKYGGSSQIKVEADAAGAVVSTWSVDGLSFIQTVTLAAENAAEHGMVSISLEARNSSGRAVPVQARILLDTCLGDKDYAHYQVSGGTLTDTIDTERLITDKASITSFYAVDDVADPGLTAYVVSQPSALAVAHWNDLAASLFDFAPDASLDFTNAVNEYLTADSACALYYDLGTVASGSSSSVVSYYGVYSNRSVPQQNSVAINAAAPLRLEVTKDKTSFVRQSGVGAADFAVTVSAENYRSDSSKDLEDLILAVRSTSNLRSLSDSGEVMNAVDFSSAEPLKIPYSAMAEGETISKTLYFQGRLAPGANYERITIGMYQSEVTSENLLGEKTVYILLPGSDGNIPQVSFISMNPDTIYSSGTRHLFAAVTNEVILTNALESGVCSFKARRKDDLLGRGYVEIPSDNISVTDGIADIALTDDVKLAAGSWTLVLEWSDKAVADGIVSEGFRLQSSSVLDFAVSDDVKYKNDSYGVLAAVKYGGGTGDDPYYYRLESFRDEAAFTAFSSAAGKSEKGWKEILLVFRGEFSGSQAYKKTDENGKTVGSLYYTAVSKKTVDPDTRKSRVDNCVTINNCVDFEGGTMVIYYEDYLNGPVFAEASPIIIEFDGELLTSDERSPIWTGKAGLTKLEQGRNFSLITYNKNGVRTNTNQISYPITLLWPNVLGVGQTIAGLVFKLAYGQFGVMKDGGSEIGRVISFTASFGLNILRTPDDDDIDQGTASYFGRMQELWSDWKGASICQYAYHGARYEKLTDLSMNDKDTSKTNGKGIPTSVMVQDILFGCGEGFVGMNFTVDVTVKNMIEGLPVISGKLSVNTVNDWAFSLSGSCKLETFALEAKLSFKSRNDIPVPDEIYFFLGGFKPGFNVDGAGVLWLRGLGGGISNIYDTIFCSGGLPPLKLVVAASFSIVQVLDGNARLQIALSGLDLTASNLKIMDEIEVIKKIQLGLQWYPDIKLTAGIYVSMFERVIEGQGYIVLLGKNYSDWFFEMFIRAGLNLPKSIPVLGGMTIVGADLGASTEKIWGAIEVLKIGVGITYYWGESSVNFGSAKDKAQPTYPNLLLQGYDGEDTDFPVVYDAENDRTLYAHIGTNFEAPKGAVIVSEGGLIMMDAEGVWSDSARTSHKFNLGLHDNEDNAAAMVQLSFKADSLAQARTLAESFTVTDAKTGGTSFPLVFYDGGNLEEANANVSWSEEDGMAAFGFTVTNESQYGMNWFISTGETPADVVLYNVLPMPQITSVSGQINSNELYIEWEGTGLDELDRVSFFLAESDDPAEDAGYPLCVEEDSYIIEGGMLEADIPADLPSGEYLLRAVYSKDEELNGTVVSQSRVSFVNPNAPGDLQGASAAPAGDLKIGVTIPASEDGNTSGYSVAVYNADGTPADVSAKLFEKAESGGTYAEIGGRYTAEIREDQDDPDSPVTGSEEHGLEGGARYIVGITPYKLVDSDGDGEEDCMVYGRELMLPALTLPEAQTPAAKLTAEGKTLTSLKDMDSGSEIPVFTVSDLEINAVFSEAVTGRWSLDSSEIWETGEDDGRTLAGVFSGPSAVISLADLTDGDHTLNLSGRASDGDSFAASYNFSVDTLAPRLIIGSPVSGSPFGGDGSLTLSGITDADALITVSVDGRTLISGKTAAQAGGTLDSDGLFSLELKIPDHNSASVHTLVISAEDANGNAAEPRTIIVAHPGLGDLAALELMAGNTVPADGNISTENAGSAALKVLGVTSDGTRFVLDPDTIRWNSYAAEGAAAVSAEGELSWETGTKGFAEAMVEVSSGAYMTAVLSLGSQSESGYVSLSSTIGGSVSGAGYYEAGDTVTLSARADKGYSFVRWEISGASVSDPDSAVISFVMPKDSVSARAVFKADSPAPRPDPLPSGGGGTSSPIAYADVPAGADPNTYVPYFLDEEGNKVIIPISSVLEDGRLAYLRQPGKDVSFMENGKSFVDIDGHWAKDNILWTAAHGLFEGVGQGRFAPQSTMTRAMFVTVLYRVAQCPPVSGRSKFTDVVQGSWYEDAVIWGAENGIVEGVSETLFSPDTIVTREQMCALVARFIRSRGYELRLGEKFRFKDAELIATWARADVEYCQRAGIIEGKSDGIFDPKAGATRAENATVMKRMIEAIIRSLR